MTPEQEHAIVVVTLISAILSFFGSLFIIVNIFRYGKVKILFWRLLVCLSISDFALSVTEVIGACALLFGYSFSGALCQIQGFFMEFLEEVSNFYVLAISILVYSIILKKTHKWSKHAEIICHTLIFLVAFILGIIPLVSKDIHYGPAGSWCWVEEKPAYARFVLSYMIVWTVMIFICVVYVRLWFFIKNPPLVEMINQEKLKKRKRLLRQLFSFPFAFMLLWIPATINRVAELVHPPIFGLVFMQSLFLPLQGLLNAVCYGIISKVFSNRMERPLLSHNIQSLQSETTTKRETI